MTNYKRGDVVLVRFPFSEIPVTKKRPALIVSDDDYHRGRQDVILAAITSNIERILVGDAYLQDWKSAGLLFPSTVTAIVQTIKADSIEKKLGELSHRDFEKVQASLKKAMGF